MKDLEDIQDAYNILFACEFALRAWAADFKLEFWKNPLTLVDFAATAPPVLSFFELVSARDPVLRFLRLTPRRSSAASRWITGILDADAVRTRQEQQHGDPQLAGIRLRSLSASSSSPPASSTTLEYTTNPNVNDLNDTLYWAILTLTGIGQPFEVVTAGGTRRDGDGHRRRALVVVPGQLAKLATVAGAQDIIEGFKCRTNRTNPTTRTSSRASTRATVGTALPAVNASMAVAVQDERPGTNV